jgi:hypothetical protein
VCLPKILTTPGISVLASAESLTSVTIGLEKPDLYAPDERLWHNQCLRLAPLLTKAR